MTTKIARAIDALCEISTIDLDQSTVEELAQLQFWISRHQGAIYVRTVVRLSAKLDKMSRAEPT